MFWPEQIQEFGEDVVTRLQSSLLALQINGVPPGEHLHFHPQVLQGAVVAVGFYGCHAVDNCDSGDNFTEDSIALVEVWGATKRFVDLALMGRNFPPAEPDLL